LDRNTQVEVTPKEDGLNIRFLKEKTPRASDDDVMKAAKGISNPFELYEPNHVAKEIEGC